MHIMSLYSKTRRMVCTSARGLHWLWVKYDRDIRDILECTNRTKNNGSNCYNCYSIIVLFWNERNWTIKLEPRSLDNLLNTNWARARDLGSSSNDWWVTILVIVLQKSASYYLTTLEPRSSFHRAKQLLLDLGSSLGVCNLTGCPTHNLAI